MRLQSIDVLRGIAILGILFMNLPFHANVTMGYVPFDPPLSNDTLVTALYTIFADGRFRTLFCILFGAGLAIQYEACKRKNIDSTIFLKSRLHWLLLFGLLHAVFIFGGDILMLYSLTALLFLKGLALETSTLLKKSRKFLIIGSILSLIFAALIMLGSHFEPSMTRDSEKFLMDHAAWRLDYLHQILYQGGFALLLLIASPISILWQVLGLMYLGAYLYRSGFFESGFENATLAKVTVAAIVTTLLALAPQLGFENMDMAAILMLSSISAIFVALIYAHIIVRVCRSPSLLAKIFEAPGKVAFSLYIFQSISLGLLLRFILPDFALTATMLDYLGLALVFTIIQIILAHVYLRYRQQGPLEYLWRNAYSRSVERKLAAREGIDKQSA